MCTKFRTRNQRRGGRSDREQHGLSPEGPKAQGIRGQRMRCVFSTCFWVPNNIIKYDGKTNPSIWLDDYCLTYRAGRADNDLFIT
jgi:hypothetical protein